MTGKRILPPTTRRYIPQPPEPIGTATTCAAARRAGEGIVNLARSCGPLLALVDPRGRVYAMPRASERARIFGDDNPQWVVGVFNRAASGVDVAEAILETFAQIGRVLA